jgi:hypothetical protein
MVNTGHDGRIDRPREVDPVVGVAPHVLAPHLRLGLLVDHRAAHIGDVRRAELLDQRDRRTGVGDVVGDEYARTRKVDHIGDGRQHDRHVQSRVDAGVELDVDHMQVLYAERVPERRSGKQAAASDPQNDVGHEVVVGDASGQRPAGRVIQVPGQILAYRIREGHGLTMPDRR